MGTLSKFNLNQYINQYNISTFIETGTAYGAGLSYAATFNFDKIYSIEFNENLANECKNKFSSDSRINILNDNSLNGLVSIFKTEKNLDNALYWLDAHYPYDDYNLGNDNLRLPLEDELNAIRKYRNGKKDVIIIDDLRIYEVNDYEAGNLPNHINRGNYININFVYDIFDKTHNIEKDLSHQGYLILTPKQ